MAGMFAVGLASNLAQAGFHINSESLEKPKWEKLNPAMNWEKIISIEGLKRGGLAGWARSHWSGLFRRLVGAERSRRRQIASLNAGGLFG